MQTHIRIRNSQASSDLIIPLTIEPNTGEETVLANVLANSRKIKRWVKSVPAHDRVAVLCGGGPSLADTFNEIKSIDGDVFALNGAASFLSENGILPDYQVIMDAQPATVGLIGPAKQHLFASQVDPACFELVPDAILWHATYGDKAVDEQDGFPEHDDGYCLIGSSVSVGNTAMVLMRALGYRTIHCFGFDCSQKLGRSHAYPQPMNDGEPCTIERINDAEYICSVSMAYSARQFMARARALQDQGCVIHVHGHGFLPEMWKESLVHLDENEKYKKMWSFSEYRQWSPGEESVDHFFEIVKPSGLVIDFGCGTGRASLKIQEKGCDVVLVDFASNCRDPSAQHLKFCEMDLSKPMPLRAGYGFCCDVMEHIPESQVEEVARNIMKCADEVYFRISTVPDSMGELIGHHLHLCVRPAEWWASLFERLGHNVTYSVSGLDHVTLVVKK